MLSCKRKNFTFAKKNLSTCPKKTKRKNTY